MNAPGKSCLCSILRPAPITLDCWLKFSLNSANLQRKLLSWRSEVTCLKALGNQSASLPSVHAVSTEILHLGSSEHCIHIHLKCLCGINIKLLCGLVKWPCNFLSLNSSPPFSCINNCCICTEAENKKQSTLNSSFSNDIMLDNIPLTMYLSFPVPVSHWGFLNSFPK